MIWPSIKAATCVGGCAPAHVLTGLLSGLLAKHQWPGGMGSLLPLPLATYELLSCELRAEHCLR